MSLDLVSDDKYVVSTCLKAISETVTADMCLNLYLNVIKNFKSSIFFQ